MGKVGWVLCLGMVTWALQVPAAGHDDDVVFSASSFPDDLYRSLYLARPSSGDILDLGVPASPGDEVSVYEVGPHGRYVAALLFTAPIGNTELVLIDLRTGSVDVPDLGIHPGGIAWGPRGRTLLAWNHKQVAIVRPRTGTIVTSDVSAATNGGLLSPGGTTRPTIDMRGRHAYVHAIVGAAAGHPLVQIDLLTGAAQTVFQDVPEPGDEPLDVRGGFAIDERQGALYFVAGQSNGADPQTFLFRHDLRAGVTTTVELPDDVSPRRVAMAPRDRWLVLRHVADSPGLSDPGLALIQPRTGEVTAVSPPLVPGVLPSEPQFDPRARRLMYQASTVDGGGSVLRYDTRTGETVVVADGLAYAAPFEEFLVGGDLDVFASDARLRRVVHPGAGGLVLQEPFEVSDLTTGETKKLEPPTGGTPEPFQVRKLDLDRRGRVLLMLREGELRSVPLRDGDDVAISADGMQVVDFERVVRRRRR